MKVPISWLNEYVDVADIPVRELADKLTFSGVEVEGIEEIGVVLDDHFVVGEVLTCEAHPNSDHLHVCTVSDGTETLPIVCGAPNCRAGIKVALARIGAVVPEGGFTIKQAKRRGAVSRGMLCSARELKLSDDHDGIMILDADAVPGTPLRTILPPPETVLDLEITWNRPDCLSIIGLAREFAALLGRPLRMPGVAFETAGEPVEQLAAVRVEAPDLCWRYTARVLTQVEDGPSPAWMQRRLEQCGVRPLGLIVDVTNYVMLECGQPLHAFDHRHLADRTIIVRRAREGEHIRTLDGMDRTLDSEMLVIADAHEPAAIAGVMGGAESEIVEGTRTVLVESALFAAPSNKRTATTLGLRSESSHRFERGVDLDLADWASRRAVALLAQYGNARVAPGVIDADHRPAPQAPVRMRFQRAREVIGLPLAPETMIGHLTSLGLQTADSDSESATFAIPSWRVDLECEADLIEEVARLHGLDELPDIMPLVLAVPGTDDTRVRAVSLCRQTLLGFGLSEAMHYSFLSADELNTFDATANDRRLVLPNPVSADYAVMRDSLLPQLVQSLGRNFARQMEAPALFEIGRVFSQTPEGGLTEEEHLSIGFGGPFGRGALDRRRSVTNEEALLWLKGIAESLLCRLHAGEPAFEPAEHPAFEPGWGISVALAGEKIGLLGLIRGTLRHAWRMNVPMAVGELKLEPLLAGFDKREPLKPVPAYPGVRRDLALLVPASLTHERIVEAIREAAPESLTDIRLFDIFMPKETRGERRSLAYTLEFRSAERTLTDDEVNAACQKIIKAVSETLGAEVRAG